MVLSVPVRLPLTRPFLTRVTTRRPLTPTSGGGVSEVERSLHVARLVDGNRHYSTLVTVRVCGIVLLRGGMSRPTVERKKDEPFL